MNMNQKEIDFELDRLKTKVLELEKKNKALEHHKDTTVGLWATDRPDLVDDPKKILFQLEFHEGSLHHKES